MEQFTVVQTFNREIRELIDEFAQNNMSTGVELAVDFSANVKSTIGLFKEIRNFFAMVLSHIDKVKDETHVREYVEKYLHKIDVQIEQQRTIITGIQKEILKLQSPERYKDMLKIEINFVVKIEYQLTSVLVRLYNAIARKETNVIKQLIDEIVVILDKRREIVENELQESKQKLMELLVLLTEGESLDSLRYLVEAIIQHADGVIAMLEK